MDNNTENKAVEEYEVRPDVLNYDDIRRMVPKLDGHEKLVNSCSASYRSTRSTTYTAASATPPDRNSCGACFSTASA